MHWFLQMLGFEVTVLGRVGHDVILATPLPEKALKQPPRHGDVPRPPRQRRRVEVNEEYGVLLSQADGIFWRVFTGGEWRYPDRRWKS